MEFCPCYRTRLSEQEGKEQMQTRSADENATGCFRCTECGYTFREYTYEICQKFYKPNRNWSRN